MCTWLGVCVKLVRQRRMRDEARRGEHSQQRDGAKERRVHDLVCCGRRSLSLRLVLRKRAHIARKRDDTAHQCSVLRCRHQLDSLQSSRDRGEGWSLPMREPSKSVRVLDETMGGSFSRRVGPEGGG